MSSISEESLILRTQLISLWVCVLKRQNVSLQSCIRFLPELSMKMTTKETLVFDQVQMHLRKSVQNNLDGFNKRALSAK